MGGGGSAPQRSFGSEWPDIKTFEKGQFNQLHSYVSGSPLMDTASNQALSEAQAAYNFYYPILSSGGELSPQLARSVTQDTRNAFAARGNNYGNQSAVAEVMNREQYREGRVAQAQAGLNTSINEATGVQSAAVNQFAALVDPVIQYMSTLFQGNLAAQVQAQQANQGKAAGTAGGIISGVSSIAGKVLPLAFSDERLKQKIRDTGKKTREGAPVKTFEYKTRPGVRFLGFLSRDVKSVSPKDVFVEPRSGIEFVSKRFAPIELSGALKGAVA